MGTLATTLVLLKSRDPESKGIVERRNGYFETSFMPGRIFASPHDFNAQFTDWLVGAIDAGHPLWPSRRRGWTHTTGYSGRRGTENSTVATNFTIKVNSAPRRRSHPYTRIG